MFDSGRDEEPGAGDGSGGARDLGDHDVAELAASHSEAAHDALRAAAQLDLDQTEPFDLMRLVSELESTRRLLDAAEAHALAALDAASATEHSDGLSTSAWLARQTNLPYGAARRRVSLARRLGTDLGTVDAALRIGRIGVDHARVLADAVNDRNREAMLPALATLIDAATATEFGHWRTRVQTLGELADLDGPHDPDHDLARNRLHLSPTGDLLQLRGELVGEARLNVTTTIEAVADELFRQWDRDRETYPGTGVPDRATLRALALDEICRRALGTDLESTRPARNGITIVLHESTTTSTAESSDRPDITGTIFDPLGSPIPVRSVPTFLCDADFYGALVDALGVPLDAGRSLPSPTPAQVRALKVRDGGCTFPGCDRPGAWTDAHHVRRRRHGGPTDLRNLVLLCRHHHRVAHRADWSVELTDDGWTRWTTPDGRTRWGQRHHRLRAGP